MLHERGIFEGGNLGSLAAMKERVQDLGETARTMVSIYTNHKGLAPGTSGSRPLGIHGRNDGGKNGLRVASHDLVP